MITLNFNEHSLCMIIVKKIIKDFWLKRKKEEISISTTKKEMKYATQSIINYKILYQRKGVSNLEQNIKDSADF